MAVFTREGYGQVEPNQLSGIKTGQIYASLPLDPTVKVLQNGEFMYYDYATNMVVATDSTNVAEPMLVYNEVKLYEPFWRTSYKDFAIFRVGENYVTSKLATAGYGGGATTTSIEPNPAHTEYGYRMSGFAPRLVKTNVGDIMTTNMVMTGDEYKVKNILGPSLVTQADGTRTLVLNLEGDTTKMAWVVVKVYTMPDGQPGLKLQRVK